MTAAPRILAIDAARVLGFAYGEAGKPPISGVVVCAKPGEHRAATFSGAGRWMTKFAREHPIDILVIEAPFHASLQNNARTAEALLGLPAVLEFMAWQFGITRLERVNQASVKKHFVGAGKGNQKDPVRAKCLALGWITADEAKADKGFNRTDALSVWSWAENRFAPRLTQPVDPIFLAAQNRARRAA